MPILEKISNGIVALCAAISLMAVLLVAPNAANAQTAVLDELFVELQQPDQKDWKSIETKIWREWSKSGSRSMDLLLQRGKDAMERGDITAAIGHFSALIDHAPDFAEGWNARATAFFLADRYGLSVSDIQHTLALNPRHFGAMSGLGMILERLDKPKEALEVYQRALEVHPYRPDVIDAVKRLEAQIEGTSL